MLESPSSGQAARLHPPLLLLLFGLWASRAVWGQAHRKDMEPGLG